jgi:mevalonate kinase
MMSSILSNQHTLQNAESRATTNKSMDDIAIDASGSIFAITKDGNVEKVSFRKFDRSKHRALTYGELGQLRRTRPELVND